MSRGDDLAGRLALGLNGDPDQRAATTLLATAVGGVWLAKLAGWDQYVVPLHDLRRPGALYVDWPRLRADRAADQVARNEFAAWAESPAGRRASDDEHDTRWDQAVPARPWHGASTGELAILDIALTIAPGGLLAEGITGLDPGNRQAVSAALHTLLGGQYLDPSWDTPNEIAAARRDPPHR
jgi:hypothetical protein